MHSRLIRSNLHLHNLPSLMTSMSYAISIRNRQRQIIRCTFCPVTQRQGEVTHTHTHTHTHKMLQAYTTGAFPSFVIHDCSQHPQSGHRTIAHAYFDSSFPKCWTEREGVCTSVWFETVRYCQITYVILYSHGIWVTSGKEPNMSSSHFMTEVP
jgi:hypothetical protein